MHGGVSSLRQLLGRAVLVGLAATAACPAGAHADNRGAIKAILTVQMTELRQEGVLGKCLAASPTKNTPCIVRQSAALAALEAAEIATIRRALDGTEADCVRQVAALELRFLRTWRAGALALNANHRSQAKRLFQAAMPAQQAEQKLEARCFTAVASGVTNP